MDGERYSLSMKAGIISIVPSFGYEKSGLDMGLALGIL
jgi:hypothetical protein